MKFSDVADALMVGKRVRKTSWDSHYAYMIYEQEYNTFDFYLMSDGSVYNLQSYTTLDLTPKDLMSNDWEVVE